MVSRSWRSGGFAGEESARLGELLRHLKRRRIEQLLTEEDVLAAQAGGEALFEDPTAGEGLG